MKCLCCGLEIINPSAQEHKDQWHHHCVKDFFGTDALPYVEISESELEEIASANAERGLTIPGVQKKLSLHHESGDGRGNRLTLVDYPTGYILKPQTREYANLPESEFLAMQMSELLGVRTVPYALIRLKDSLAYITKRIDRKIEKSVDGNKTTRLAMEDFCQLSERLSEDKYNGSYEACARIIKKYSSQPGLDLAELFVRIVSAFMIGNADMHLKNLSLIEKTPASRTFELSLSYDILPVNVVDPQDTDELALSLNGKKNKLEREDFLKFAEYCGLNQTAAEKIMAKICSKESECVRLCQDSYLNDTMKNQMTDLIHARSTRLA
ncbi:MAG: HipA domain-containing protein [Candidatus Saccharibacteria bacterium]|nr:HipA domain-containing protein [Candidatus Saccharibacteria bacterium]